MSESTTPAPDQNPYHPYEETDRYRAFREGWAAQQRGEPQAAVPFSFGETSRVLAWLDGWTAAAGGDGDVIRRRRWASHSLSAWDSLWDTAQKQELEAQ